MKTQLKFKRIYLATALLIVLFSCKEDFLDNPLSETIAEEDVLSNPENATGLVNAVYNHFLNWNMSSFSWIGITTITSDNADKGSDPGDTGTDKHHFDDFTFSSNTISLNETWLAHYQGIFRANQALTYIPNLALEEDLKKRLIGEAKFLRALMYFRLSKMFGGVPLIDRVLDPNISEDEIAGNTRATLDEIHKFIEQDLSDAVSSLPEKSDYPSTELGRATKGAAKALLAKMNMYKSTPNWKTVKDLTNEIIASKEYSLVSDYATIWREEGEHNSESIFEINGKGDEPRLGVQGYSATQGARGAGGWGWGFATPSQDFVDSFEAGDVRLDATVIFRGETLFDGREVPNTVSNMYYNEKAYNTNYTAVWESPKNIRILRYAEVLLMNAEAALNVGGDATTPLNEVRTRAGLNEIIDPTIQNVWLERRHELGFEHDRTFDLRRQGRAAEVITAHGKPFIEGRHELFPIPQDQVDGSNGLLTQNLNY